MKNTTTTINQSPSERRILNPSLTTRMKPKTKVKQMMESELDVQSEQNNSTIQSKHQPFSFSLSSSSSYANINFIIC
ncbi:unnamed protein product [Debaryomyces tyrocola]|nr:unnamed protein product [Debaryomyces tyrocola]